MSVDSRIYNLSGLYTNKKIMKLNQAIHLKIIQLNITNNEHDLFAIHLYILNSIEAILKAT